MASHIRVNPMHCEEASKRIINLASKSRRLVFGEAFHPSATTFGRFSPLIAQWLLQSASILLYTHLRRGELVQLGFQIKH
jgi:hypothetical protein